MLVETNVMAVCPKLRIAKKPKKRWTGFEILAIMKTARPNEATTPVRVTLAPNLSNALPARNAPKAALIEPALYSPETRVRDHPVSSMMGSMNRETMYVCPGPDVKMPRAPTAAITHP
jgi:hypothetical protein